jgi:hypothetical protein
MPGTIRITTLVSTLVTAALISLGGGAAFASDNGRKEQVRYAKETMRMTADTFMARKGDFIQHGCWVGPAGCNKPFPYNQFDWSDDGCSKTPAHLASRFRSACLQHDFGYRNFGKGLTLGRTENMRSAVDKEFRSEMYRICERTFSGRQRKVCRSEAYSMWGAVRHFNDWQES